MAKTTLQWDDEALASLKRVPAFVRPLAKRKIEKAAKAQGIEIITLELVHQVKQKQMA